MLGTLFVGTAEESRRLLKNTATEWSLKFDPARTTSNRWKARPSSNWLIRKNVVAEIGTIKKVFPKLIASIRLPLDENAVGRALKLTLEGAEILHFFSDVNGLDMERKATPSSLICSEKFTQNLWTKPSARKLRILASGGIALAEHVAKTIICGADAVGAATALTLALGCRMCAECGDSVICPVDIENAPVEWGAQRIVNLLVRGILSCSKLWARWESAKRGDCAAKLVARCFRGFGTRLFRACFRKTRETTRHSRRQSRTRNSSVKSGKSGRLRASGKK